MTTCQTFSEILHPQRRTLRLNFFQTLDGTLGDWNTESVSLKLKADAKPYHGRAYPVPKVHKEVLIKELNRLCELGLSGTCLRHVVSCVAVTTDVLMTRETSSTRATCSGRVTCRQLGSRVV
jgi:hypothetical protein